ncbi:thioesterase II family protein [Viridibacillus sp. NPDC096237]|uniref:thioesterase II family protein n=1 Tax=Viridibacillus sp. NPDC096237 TaxID=3390721 RepID=UPI003CFEE734
MKVVMLPCAGGNSMMFQNISALLAESMQTYALDYPGHGRRIQLPLLNSLREIADDILEEMSKIGIFNGEPYVLLGYSMGSIICYEITRRLIEKGMPVPKHLFLSASATVHMEQREPITSIPEEELYTYLKELGGTSNELLDNKEFQNFYFPIIKADLIALSKYQADSTPKLPISATIMYGSEDKYTKEEIYAWENYIRSCSFKEIMGGHFFIYQAEDQMNKIIKKIIST